MNSVTIGHNMRLSEVAEIVEKILDDLRAVYTTSDEFDEEGYVHVDYHYRGEDK